MVGLSMVSLRAVFLFDEGCLRPFGLPRGPSVMMWWGRGVVPSADALLRVLTPPRDELPLVWESCLMLSLRLLVEVIIICKYLLCTSVRGEDAQFSADRAETDEGVPPIVPHYVGSAAGENFGQLYNL